MTIVFRESNRPFVESFARELNQDVNTMDGKLEVNGVLLTEGTPLKVEFGEKTVINVTELENHEKVAE